MLVPKCHTCGRVFTDKEIPYEKALEKLKTDNEYITSSHDFNIQTEKAKILEGLGITRYCCKMRFISYIDQTKLIL